MQPRKPELRAVRQTRGITLRALARAADVDCGYLSRLERGLEIGGGPAAKRVARALDVDLAPITESREEGNVDATAIAVAPVPKLRTPEEVSTVLKVKPVTVIRWARAGRIGHTKVGRFYRFTDQHVADYLAAGDVPAGQKIEVPAAPARNPRRKYKS